MSEEEPIPQDPLEILAIEAASYIKAGTWKSLTSAQKTRALKSCVSFSRKLLTEVNKPENHKARIALLHDGFYDAVRELKIGSEWYETFQEASQDLDLKVANRTHLDNVLIAIGQDVCRVTLLPNVNTVAQLHDRSKKRKQMTDVSLPQGRVHHTHGSDGGHPGTVYQGLLGRLRRK